MEIDLIDYRHPRIEANRRLIGGRWIKKKTLIQNLRSVLRDCLDYRIEKSRQKKFDSFVKKNTNLSNAVTDKTISQLNSDYCTYIVGSDLVWNWEIDTELNSVFFLEFSVPETVKKVSYASSIGSDNIPKRYVKQYKDALEKFDSISVRESSAQIMLQEICERDISCVVDPTLLLGKEQWMRFEKKTQCPEHFVFLYILQETKDVDEIIKHTIEYYQMPVVYYSKKNKNNYPAGSMNVYSTGPDEFLYLIHKADFVVTNSFHGMAFSLIYDKGFICIPHTTRGTRMIDCLKKIGMINHCCREVSEINFEICSKNLTESDRTMFEQWKHQSLEYAYQIVNT